MSLEIFYIFLHCGKVRRLLCDYQSDMIANPKAKKSKFLPIYMIYDGNRTFKNDIPLGRTYVKKELELCLWPSG